MKNRWILLGILLVTATVYWGAWDGYFQQDEWSGFGRVAIAQSQGFSALIRFSGLHFTPFSILLVALFYELFGLNHVAYGLYSLFLHATNIYLVYLLAQFLTKNKVVSILSALFFLTTFTPFQAVTWYAASLSFLPSAFLSLNGLVLFEWYLATGKRFALPFALALIFLAAGFRENAIALLVYCIVRSRHVWREVTAVGLAYIGIRFLPLLFTSKLTTVAPHISQFEPLHIFSQGMTFIVFYLPRLLIPTPIPLALGKFVFGSTAGLAQDSILSIFYIFVWSLIGVLGVFLRKQFFKDTRRVLLPLAVFIFLSIAPFAFIPPPHIMESRHYYLTAVGYAIFMAFVWSRLFERAAQRGKIMLGLILFVLVTINVLLIRQEVTQVIQTGKSRIYLVQTIQTMYKTVSPKSVFFSAGDTPPFQSGVGQMLLVLFHRQYDYSGLLSNYFLWGIDEQGYRESDGVGFGFYTDFSPLTATYCQYKLTPDNVFSFSWSGKENVLKDVSQDIRARLSCPRN